MPKVWLALFFGYNGSTFSGMQFQLEQHVNTVEDLLVEKLYSAGFLTTKNHSQLEKQQRWSRAARTDKGVHAIVNSISCLFVIDKIYYDQQNILNPNKLMLDLKELFQDTEIVFHTFKRVTTRFEVRHLVRSRHYCYICPIFLFGQILNKQHIQIQSAKFEEINLKKLQQKKQQQKNQAIESLVQKKDEQSIDKLLSKINECCKQFIGTHNFHNYSKNLRAKDPQAQRYILSFKAQKLNQNYLIFDLVGQSFIYHQIRKMVGCIIMVFLNNYPTNYITNTFFRNQINMPLAPPHGLYLHSLSFQNYNKKKDIPEPLTFDQLKTVGNLQQSINNYIIQQQTGQWRDWVTKLRQSIYHGIQYVQQVQQIEGKELLED